MRSRATGVLCLVLLAALSASASAVIYPGKIGVGGASWEFVNLADHSYRYSLIGGGDLTSSDVDADGWPTCDVQWVWDDRPVAEWAADIDDPEVYRRDNSGVWHGSFTGQATLTHIEGPWTFSNQQYNSGTNTTTFDLTMDPPGAHHGLIVMTFTDTRRTPASPTGSGLTDFRLIRPGYPADTTQLFSTDVVNCYNTASFAAIRYLHVNGNTEWDANGPLFQSWSNRKLPTDAVQGDDIPPMNKKDLWCYEYYIDLCNQTQKDFWLCVPIAADDNYLNQLAQLVYDNLDPNLNVYLENSNEVWNYGFNQYAWNKAMAVEEVGTGADYDYDGNSSEEVWHYRRHANRTMDIVNAFANVFGQNEVNNRVRGVLCWWAIHLDWLQTYMLPYIQDNYGAPSSFFYGIGLATYMGGDAAGGHAGTENYTVSQILDDMRATATSSIPTRQNWIAAAANWNLPGGCLAYETGTDTGGGSTTNVGNRIMAVRDARMYTELTYNYEDCWLALGGNLTMDLSLAGKYSRYGCWGLTDDPSYPDRNYQMQVIRDLLGDSITEPPTAPTNLTAMGGDQQVFLDWNMSPTAQTYNVKRSETGGGPYTTIATDVVDTNYTDTGLTNYTTYYYVVSGVNTVGEGPDSNEASATPQPDTTPPAAPTNLVATPGDGEVDLDWDDNTEGDLATYSVYRDTTSGGPYSQIKTGLTVSAYTDTTVTNGTTYYYVVTALDTSSNESGYSNEASATPTATPVGLLAWDFVGEGGAASSTADSIDPDISSVPPSAVAAIGPGLNPLDYIGNGLTATQSTAMTLAEALAADDYMNWTITPESGVSMTLTKVDIRPVSQNRTRTFTVFSSINGFTEGSEVGSFEESANFNAPIHTVTLSGHADLTAAVEFRLYIHGYDNQYESVGMGNGDGDDLIVWGTTGTGQQNPPPAPQNLVATPGDSQVQLNWDVVAEADNYNVYRSTGGNYYWQAAPADNSYLDTDVTNGVTYWYYVTAENGAGESDPSNSVEATPQGDTTPPGAPTNLSATAGDGVVDLDWDNNSEPDLDSYSVYRDTSSGGPYGQIASGLANSDYSDSAVTNGTTYYYVVTAVDTSSNESEYSNEASATPQGDITPPAAPTNLSATAGDGVVDLDWDDNSEPDLDSYSVYRDTSSGGPYGQIASAVAASEYSDSTVTNGTTYYYVVTAVDSSSNESGYSNEASATPQDTTPPDAPTNLSATGGDGVVDLDWDDNSEPDLDSYSVYRDTSSGGPYGQIASGLANSDYSDTDVTNGVTYYYVVTAVDTASNESGYSNEASATPNTQAATMHVDSIVVEWIEAGGPNRKGQATVVVKDNLGNVVQGATVTGTFSGTLSETQSGTTDGTGTAVIQTKGKTRNPGGLTFCVDGVTHATLDYAPGDNVETCDSI
jgi:fibronectin type 3 domain-containing protein